MNSLLILVAALCLLLGCIVIATILIIKRRSAGTDKSDDKFRTQLLQLASEIKTDISESNLNALSQVTQQLAMAAGQKVDAATSAAEAAFDQKKNLIDAQLNSVSSSLGQVNKAIADLAIANGKSYGSVASQLAATSSSTSDLAKATRSIHDVLNHSRARGQHGEFSAEGVLHAAGLVQGIHYEKQTANEAGTRPDFIVKIGSEKSISVDSKFPLSNLWRSFDAESEVERKSLEAVFLRDVRDRVNELTLRDYVGEDTIDLIVMFLANEAVFGFVLEHDPGIFEFSMNKKVVITGPFGLYALLSTIRQGADNLVVARKSQEILALMRTFKIQWEKFTSGLDLLGKKLQQVDKTFDALTSTRKSQLDRALTRIDSLSENAVCESLTTSDEDKSGRDEDTAANKTEALVS
jgi:DNA recombination protein RmuC